MSDLFRRLRYLWNRNRIEQELSDEMDFHREMAHREGRANFGNALHLREESRESWGWMWLDRLRQDVRYAARMLYRSPGVSLAAVLMLAIGIGVNVAVFGFFDLMVLRPLNVRDPNSLLRFHRRSPQAYAFALPYPEMAFFREHSRTLSTVLAINMTRVAIEGEDKHLEAHFVTPDFFTDLGAVPVIGRTLLPQDTAPVVVLSHGFWKRHFGGDTQVIGRTLEVNGNPATIAGVVPPEFSGLNMSVPALWAPIAQQPYFAAGSKLLTDFTVESPGVQMFGRLKPGISPHAAEEELGLLAAELRKQAPDHIWEKETLPSDPGGYAQSLTLNNRRGTGTEARGELFQILAMIATLGLLILSVACANLGSLLLARGVSREREIGIRLAVGAGGGRLVRQLFTESLLLALLGSAAGLGLGYMVLRSLMAFSGAPAWLNAAPDWRVILFSLAAGFTAAIFFGLMPALQIARQKHRTTVMRQVLIGAQVAASCVLLIVAGLLGRALDRAISTHPGFDYERVIALDPGLSRHGYSAAKSRAYLDALQTRLKSLPGVQSTSLALAPPLGRVTISAGNAIINHVDAQFFNTMKIPIVRGRNLERGDTRAVVVGESLARKTWPGEDPLSKKFNLGEDYTVVGVAGSARTIRTEDSDAVEVYMPIVPGDLSALFVLVRTAGSPEELARAAVIAARAIDPGTFPEVQTLKSGMARKREAAQATAIAVTAMGVIAQLLACLGIVGVVSYAVSQRTKEIGIRMALGAKPGHVLRVVLSRLILPVSIGLLAGVFGAVALSQALRQTLFGISHLDPTAYASAIAIFVVTVAVAAILPARKALRVDPLSALRWE